MQYGGTVTWGDISSSTSINLKWFDTQEEYVEAMAESLVRSDFQPKRWWQFWRTQVCSQDVLNRVREMRG